MVVRGHLKGQISGPSLRVDSGGSVSGHVKVHQVDSEGVLEGKLEADFMVLSGQVKDGSSISAQAIEVRANSGASFGQCEIHVGQVMDKGQAVAAARQAASSSRPNS
jgi:cytoskeletal protein CcmA (bactofilin family)